MNIPRLIPVFPVIMMITTSCFLSRPAVTPEFRVTPLSDSVVLRDASLVYALPRSVFTVKVEFERTIEIPGPYARFAEELLGLENVITDETENWSVRSVSVNSHEEADPSEFYVIESNTMLISNVLALKKEGLILDLNPQLFTMSESYSDSKEIDINRFRLYDLGSDEYYRVQTDTAYKRVSVEEQFIRIPYLVEQKKKLSDAQLAERAARRLMELREGKFLILTGEANVFPQDKAAIEEINKMEKELIELFAGKIISDIRTFTYSVIPDKDMTGTPRDIFRFSEVTGPGETGTETGTPVVMELIPENKTKDLSVILRARPDPAVPVPDKIYYRIPDIVNVVIRMDDEILYDSRKIVYQLGTVLQLPSNYVIR